MRRLVAPLALLLLAVPALADSKPPTREQDVIYGRKFGTALTMDVFRPVEGRNSLGVIFVVSGGWFSSHDSINQAFIRPLTDRGYTVFAVVHGSQPKFTIPEAVADLNRAVRFIRSHAADYKIDGTKLAITGASAGGHLSLMQGLAGDNGNPQAADPVDRAPSRVAAVACFFPPTDFLNYGETGKDALGRNVLEGFAAPFDFHEFDPKRKKFVEVTDEVKLREIGKQVSPITHVSADDPPTLILHGDADKLVPIQQAQLVVDQLKAAGVDAKLVVKPGAGHGWPGIDKDISTFADWFDAHLIRPDAAMADLPIPSAEAKAHVGERRTVETTVRASKDSDMRKEIYLDSAADFRDPANFTVVISRDVLGKFKAAGIEAPAAYYQGKTIRVTGPIVRENEQVRIRVEDPTQIQMTP